MMQDRSEKRRELVQQMLHESVLLTQQLIHNSDTLEVEVIDLAVDNRQRLLNQVLQVLGDEKPYWIGESINQLIQLDAILIAKLESRKQELSKKIYTTHTAKDKFKGYNLSNLRP